MIPWMFCEIVGEIYLHALFMLLRLIRKGGKRISEEQEVVRTSIVLISIDTQKWLLINV
jgi:hypothetical protein